MRDFKTFLSEQELGNSAQDAVHIIEKLDGRLTSVQWDRLIGLINKFAGKHTEKRGYSIGWNLAGTKYGPPSQPPLQSPQTLPPS